ncbi:MAG: trypsin-like serine protease [Cyclobacteriaceae bacterium]|nr:trypsin-like serine protease [Cyclobacteriaceae bacterium]
MKSRQELIDQHHKLMEVYNKVKDKLRSYPNVVSVGIGLKEKDGKLTDEGCIKIELKEKKSEKDLDPKDIIPKELEGVPTDVIVYKERVLSGTCTVDTSSHRPITGGIRISNYRNGSGRGGSGTLGVMAQLNSDNSWVILSNHHVLYGDSGQDGDDIGQPWVGCSWCCKTNVIATNVNKNEALDCAIAKVNDDIAISNVMEDIGSIAGNGSAAPVNGEKVRKRGATTGYTSGTISFINVGTNEITVDPNPAGGPANNPGGCTNYEAGVTVFTNPGDSGSVYINDNGEVVGLHYAGDNGSNKSYGHNIVPILAALNISIKTSGAFPGRTLELDPGESDIRHLRTANKLNFTGNDGWVDHFEKRLDNSVAGRKIKEVMYAHRQEVLRLVQKCRPVTVEWNRKQGPAFFAAMARSAKYPEYEIPKAIDRISLQNLLMSMAAVLLEHGSEPLKTDIEQYAPAIIEHGKSLTSMTAFFQLLERETPDKELLTTETATDHA